MYTGLMAVVTDNHRLQKHTLGSPHATGYLYPLYVRGESPLCLGEGETGEGERGECDGYTTVHVHVHV